MNKAPIKMTPGDDTHLTLLMAPVSLNFVTGADREHLLAYGRAAFEAGQKCQGCAVQQGTHVPMGTVIEAIAEPGHCMSQYASKDDMLKAVLTENQALREQLEAIGAGGVEPLRKPVQAVEPEIVVEMSRKIAELQDQLAAVQQGVQPIKANCYSDNEGDSWRDCPDDCDFVEGLKVGDTFELQASVRSWSETFRVTKAPDGTSDDYEVELVSSDAPLAAHPTQQGLDAAKFNRLELEIRGITKMLPEKFDCSGVWAAFEAAQAKQGGEA